MNVEDISSTKVERRYISGDIADIVFEHFDGSFSVVEIETDYPEPGAYQAIKYRALLCAEEKFPLDSEKVRAYLVAWFFSESLLTFCQGYEIESKVAPIHLVR